MGDSQGFEPPRTQGPYASDFMSPLAKQEARRETMSDNGEEVQAHPRNNIVVSPNLIQSQ